MDSLQTSKYFEILSHPIRFAILQFIDINERNFSEILDGIDLESEIGSSKLNFHMKKMLEENILIKRDKSYSNSEIGIKLLSLVEYFKNLDSPFNLAIEEFEENETVEEEQLNDVIKEELPKIIRPAGLPSPVSIFEYFEGKNYVFMEENYSLSLSNTINTDVNPKKWIKQFSNQIAPLLKIKLAKEWVIDRFLKLGYGTRGLQDFGLMDASLSVPPLESMFKNLIELLNTRGKVGLYAKTGMGKSRTALYIASYWSRVYKTPVLFIQNIHHMNDKDFSDLQDILSSSTPPDRKMPRWLVIIEDAHLCSESQIINVKKLIGGASNKTYSVFVSFTDIELLKGAHKSVKSNLKLIDDLRKELIPDEFVKELNLDRHWEQLRPYFKEWIKWVAVDILFDMLPTFELRDEKLDVYSSPWSFVVSLGFLKSALKHLIDTTTTNLFPLVLYYSLAQMYIMRGEIGISVKNLTMILKNYYDLELNDRYGDKWELKLLDILNSWTLPTSRLLPPFNYDQKAHNLSKEGIITFYHLEWANEVCNYLDLKASDLLIDYDDLFIKLFQILHQVWELLTKQKLIQKNFASWIRTNAKFEINKENEVVLTTLRLNQKEKKALTSFTIKEQEFKGLKNTELVNWMFIRSIISS